MHHTPGPWKITRHVTQGEFVTTTAIRAHDDSYLATVGPCNIERNAELIVKSPELLHALTLAYALLDRSEVRHYISNTLGEQAELHRTLNAARPLLRKEHTP